MDEENYDKYNFEHLVINWPSGTNNKQTKIEKYGMI